MEWRLQWCHNYENWCFVAVAWAVVAISRFGRGGDMLGLGKVKGNQVKSSITYFYASPHVACIMLWSKYVNQPQDNQPLK